MLWGSMCCVWSCTPPESSHPTPLAPSSAAPASTAPAAISAARSAPQDAATQAPPARDWHAQVKPALLGLAELKELSAEGFTLERLVAGPAPSSLVGEARSTAALNQQRSFRSLFDVLRADVRQTKRRHPLSKVTSMMGFRLFDERWLNSEEMSFELIGVFNRLDRRYIYDESCGEVRFIYRLRYTTQQAGAPMSSRLPMTLNVVYTVAEDPDGGCQSRAQAWAIPANLDGSHPSPTDPKRSISADLHWLLTEGALSPAQRASWKLLSVEANLQSIRIQSSIATTLGGHVDYVLRVFHPDAQEPTPTGGPSFHPAPMHNMPDLPKLTGDPELRARLLSFIKRPQTLQALDDGIHKLPDEYLATLATSVSPRGMARAANRPFKQLYSPSDFADLDLSSYKSIQTPIAVLRRLDADTCTGCHQTQSVAGFHALGNHNKDALSDGIYNTPLLPTSTHLDADLQRRRRYIADVASGKEPDEFRPFPETQGMGHGYGSPCGLGDAAFSEWRCDSGLSCLQTEDGEVGACYDPGSIGTPCEYGTGIRSAKRADRDAIAVSQHACDEPLRCDANPSGFSQGSCGTHCKHAKGDVNCSEFLEIDGFQNCLRAKRSLQDCEREFVFRTGLKTCDASRPCRQDYVCMLSPRDAGDLLMTPVGACVPPYFVFQLRLDGYPIPN